MKSQKEVTLAEDLELRDRTDIYRNFLLYCMSGDVVALPMGAYAQHRLSRRCCVAAGVQNGAKYRSSDFCDFDAACGCAVHRLSR